MAPFLNGFSHFNFVSHPGETLMATSPELVLFFFLLPCLWETNCSTIYHCQLKFLRGCKLETKLDEECVIKSC